MLNPSEDLDFVKLTFLGCGLLVWRGLNKPVESNESIDISIPESGENIIMV